MHGGAAPGQARRADRRGGALRRHAGQHLAHPDRQAVLPRRRRACHAGRAGHLRRALPQARDRLGRRAGFAPLVRRSTASATSSLRRCGAGARRRWTRATRARVARLPRARWRASRYDAVIDLQGLTKSALVARCARLAAGGMRYGLANRTEGAELRAADALAGRSRRSPIEPRMPCARPLARARARARSATRSRAACTRPARQRRRPRRTARRPWPSCTAPRATTSCGREAHWIDARPAPARPGWRIALPQGNDAEQTRAE